MVLWGAALAPTIEDAWRVGAECAARITNEVFPHPAIVLENETVKHPYLIFDKKKNYAAIEHEQGRDGTLHGKLIIKGLAPVRRDRIKLLKESYRAAIRVLMTTNSPQEMYNTVARVVDAVENDRLPLDKYVASKSVRARYKAGVTQPHVEAWKRMQARGDEGTPQVGGRMAFVYTVDTREGAKTKSESAEHPSFVERSRHLKVDRALYLSSIRKTYADLERFVPTPRSITRLIDDAVARTRARQMGIRDLRGMFLESAHEQSRPPTPPKSVSIPPPKRARGSRSKSLFALASKK